MVKFYNLEKSISSEDLILLEEELNFVFNEEYRNHLLKYNGGQCSPDVFPLGEDDYSSLSYFFAHSKDGFSSLRDAFLTFKIEDKMMPEEFFPIANDTSGNLICINVETNEVYFCDHESKGSMYYLTKDLKTFLDGLISEESI